MNQQRQEDFEKRLYTFVGRQVCAASPARDAVNEAMIRHWAEAVGDTNPAYTDAEWAARSARGRNIAPPAMMYSWNQAGFPVVAQGREADAQTELIDLFDEHGYSGVLATNVEQEYQREIGIGDRVTMEMMIDNISEQKATARGIGYFFETLATFSDQHGATIGTQRFRVFKFIPPQSDSPPPGDEGGGAKLQVPVRIPSPRGHDNQWWWEACDQGRVLIQRCRDCQTLRHPPRPMCGECQSTAWDSIESTLDGEVLSFTELHHPRVPGYPSPLICGVIGLQEGVNLVANIVGIESEQELAIGMRVQGRVEQVDEKTMLPQFYPVAADSGAGEET